MKIVTWNVNSLRVRLDHLRKWSEACQPDVVCLQETKTTDDAFPLEAVQKAGFPHVEFVGQKTYNGVAILSKVPLTDVVKGFVHSEDDPQKRLIRATANSIRVVNCYVPNGSSIGSEKFHYKLAWLAKLRHELETEGTVEQPSIVCGDMNISLTDNDVWDPFEAEGEILYHPVERDALQSVLSLGYQDIYRKINPEEREFSWWDYRMLGFQKNRGYRIDHLFGNQAIADRVDKFVHWRDVRKWEKPSDHIPVCIHISDA